MHHRLCTRLLNICISSLCKLQRLDKAEAVIIDGIRLGLLPDVVTYNALVDAYCRFVGIDAAYAVLRRMKVAGAFAKKGRLKEANDFMEAMLESGIAPDIVSYNTLMNIYCKERKFEAAYGLLDKMEEKGMECDHYTHTILTDGLCKAGNLEGAQTHLQIISSTGFSTNLAAYNSLLDGMYKAGHAKHAMKLFRLMKMKDEFTYSSMVHNLCKERKFRSASKLLLSCLKNGMNILKSAERAVIRGIRDSGFRKGARKLQAKIRMAKFLR